MFNPLINNISELGDNDLQGKISNLSKKYWQTKNPHLQNQIATALDQFQQEQQNRILKQQESNKDDSDLDGLIDIS